MSIINISNVINVSVLAPPAGLAPYSINNVVCLTSEDPVLPIADGYATYTSAQDVAADWGTEGGVYEAAVALFSQSPNIITGGGVLVVMKLLEGESLSDAMLRAQGVVYYGGISYTGSSYTDEDLLEAAATAQALRKLFFLVASSSSALDSGGLLWELKDQSLSHARGLYYGLVDAEKMKWAYIGRSMSTNFSATNSTITMNLKQLATVGSDTSATQTIVQKCKAVGADMYVSIAGRPSVLSHGANQFLTTFTTLTGLWARFK